MTFRQIAALMTVLFAAATARELVGEATAQRSRSPRKQAQTSRKWSGRRELNPAILDEATHTRNG